MKTASIERWSPQLYYNHHSAFTQEFELRKLEMEQDLRLREVQVNVEQDGSGEGRVPRSNRGHSVAMKALKLPSVSYTHLTLPTIYSV